MPVSSISERIWSFSRETEVAHVDDFTDRLDYRELCYAVVDAVIEIRQTGQIRRDHVDAFAKAVECSFEFVFSFGGKRLVETAHFSELAAEQLRALVSHSKWRARFNVMCLIGYGPPQALALELLTKGLVDRSEKVACRAAAACDELGDAAALDLLRSRLPFEDRREVREEIEFTIELMSTPPIRNGRYEERTVRGVVVTRDVGPGHGRKPVT
jgi:hypothetical protein